MTEERDPGAVAAAGRGERGVWVGRGDIARTLDTVEPFTMVSTEALIDLARQVDTVLADGIPGEFVECGIWRGGASFLIADLLREAGVRDRKVWMFDSFEGLPAPTDIDGPEALAYATSRESPRYRENCRVSLEDVQRSAQALGLAPYVELIKGWFEQSLPANRPKIGPIAILRLDCDWYSSVLCCLENLYEQVVDGGFIILDDYYAYDGCATAVHEFLGQRRLAHRIESAIGDDLGDRPPALFRKGKTTWYETSRRRRRTHRVHLTRQDLAALIPPGRTFVLIDDEELRDAIAGDRAIPFLERAGEFWGHPEDDDTAIRELERLRQSGASFLVIAWPAFWWRDHYAGFYRYVRSRFRCVLENDRLIALELGE